MSEKRIHDMFFFLIYDTFLYRKHSVQVYGTLDIGVHLQFYVFL